MITKYTEYIKEAKYIKQNIVSNIFVQFDYNRSFIKLDYTSIEYIKTVNYKNSTNHDNLILDSRETFFFIVSVYYYLIKNNVEYQTSDKAFFENHVSIVFDNVFVLDIIKEIDLDFKQSSEKELIENILNLKPSMFNDYFVQKFIWNSNLEDIEIVKVLKNASNFDLI